MMQRLSLNVTLSDAMRARIAAGELRCSEEEVKQNTIACVYHLSEGKWGQERYRDHVQKAMQKGSIDVLATCRYSDKFSLIERPLLHTLIYESRDMSPLDDALVKWVVASAPCDVLDDEGVPAFSAATKGVRDGRFWAAMREHPDFDMERVFVEPHRMFLPSHMETVTLNGTLLNQKCEHHAIYGDRLKKQPRRTGELEPMAENLLLKNGAILDPRWMDVLKDKDLWTRQWQEEYRQLENAIGMQDTDAVEAAIVSGAVAHGFSLGRGAQLCNPEFWGPYLELGLSVMLNLPLWVQQKMAPELTRMLQKEPPQTCVMYWSYDQRAVDDGRRRT